MKAQEVLSLSEEDKARLKKAALFAAPVVLPLVVRYARRHGVTKGYVYHFADSGTWRIGFYDVADKIKEVTGELKDGVVTLEEALLEKLRPEDVERFEEVSTILQEDGGLGENPTSEQS